MLSWIQHFHDFIIELWLKEFTRILFCGLILGFRFKRRIGLRNSSWIQAWQGNSCWLVSGQGKYTQLYWFQMLSDLLELKEFGYRKFGSEFSDILSTIRGWPTPDRELTNIGRLAEIVSSASRGLTARWPKILSGFFHQKFSFWKTNRKLTARNSANRNLNFGQPSRCHVPQNKN